MTTAPKRRRRSPVPLSRIGRIIATIERHPGKTILGALALLGGLVPAVAGIKWLDQMSDGWQFARHMWVYEQIGPLTTSAKSFAVQNQVILRDLQIDTANGKLASTNNDIKKWELELSKAKDQITIDLITKQIETLKDTQERLTNQLATLRKTKPSTP